MSFFIGFNTTSSSGSGVRISDTPPTDTTSIWVDTSSGSAVMKYYNSTSGQWESINAGVVANASEINFVPNGHVEATNLQQALEELISEKQKSVVISETEPLDRYDGMLWLCTKDEFNVLYKWRASTGKWIEVKPTSLDGGSFS